MSKKNNNEEANKGPSKLAGERVAELKYSSEVSHSILLKDLSGKHHEINVQLAESATCKDLKIAVMRQLNLMRTKGAPEIEIDNFKFLLNTRDIEERGISASECLREIHASAATYITPSFRKLFENKAQPVKVSKSKTSKPDSNNFATSPVKGRPVDTVDTTSSTVATNKPTTAQIIGTVLLACTGIGLIIGLFQLLVTAIHAQIVNTSNDIGNTATAGFLLCKLPELQSSSAPKPSQD